ncbi:MAG: hypothetical protein ACLRZH_15750 [Ruthenibacterium lactatiformans]
MILSFGRWAFRQAVRQCAVFWMSIRRSAWLSISCLQLEDPTLVEYLAQRCAEGVSAEHIIVELTESYRAESGTAFGTSGTDARPGAACGHGRFRNGYSSLSVLKHALSTS